MQHGGRKMLYTHESSRKINTEEAWGMAEASELNPKVTARLFTFIIKEGQGSFQKINRV